MPSSRSLLIGAGGVIAVLGAAAGGMVWARSHDGAAASAPAVGAESLADTAAQLIDLAGPPGVSATAPMAGGDTSLTAAVGSVRPYDPTAPATPTADTVMTRAQWEAQQRARAQAQDTMRMTAAQWAAMQRAQPPAGGAVRALPAAAAPTPSASPAQPSGRVASRATSSPAPRRSAVREGAGDAGAAGAGFGGDRGPKRTPTLEAGTGLSLLSEQEVCARAVQAGDVVQASLASSVSGPDGLLLDAGTPVSLTVASVGGEGAPFVLRLTGINTNGRTVRAYGDVSGIQTVGAKSEHAGRKVLTGAAVGALAGRLLGKSPKSTVVGAAAGAAAGGVAVAATGDGRCLPRGGRLSATLNDAVALH